MKYLKLTNVSLLEFCNHGSLTEGEKRIPWRSCGFLPSLVSKKAVQIEEEAGLVQYLPISDETKTKAFVVKLKASLEDGASVKIVSETATSDQKAWKERREIKKHKWAVKAERRRKAISLDADKPE